MLPKPQRKNLECYPKFRKTFSNAVFFLSLKNIYLVTFHWFSSLGKYLVIISQYCCKKLPFVRCCDNTYNLTPWEPEAGRFPHCLLEANLSMQWVLGYLAWQNETPYQKRRRPEKVSFYRYLAVWKNTDKSYWCVLSIIFSSQLALQLFSYYTGEIWS